MHLHCAVCDLSYTRTNPVCCSRAMAPFCKILTRHYPSRGYPPCLNQTKDKQKRKKRTWSRLVGCSGMRIRTTGSNRKVFFRSRNCGIEKPFPTYKQKRAKDLQRKRSKKLHTVTHLEKGSGSCTMSSRRFSIDRNVRRGIQSLPTTTEVQKDPETEATVRSANPPGGENAQQRRSGQKFRRYSDASTATPAPRLWPVTTSRQPLRM